MGMVSLQYFADCIETYRFGSRETLMLRLTALVILFWSSTLWAAPAGKGEIVDLQLRWHHQFQFAGYYAAVKNGYYAEEGLDVRLHAGEPGRQPVQEVLSGRAQYAEGNSEILLHRLKGKPLVALAAIFQHSPSVLLTRGDSGLRSAQDLIGKKVMLMNGMDDADFITMLLNEGVSMSQVDIIPSSYAFDDLLEGRVDAFNSYLTNEPFILKQRNIAFNVIDPRTYRVDFYSDILFTSEDELRKHPGRAEAMRRATLKGWRYAMDHPAEIIDLLINEYHVEKTHRHLEFEAVEMRKLILPELIEIGHMNVGRWQHMADTFVKAGLIEADYTLDGFVYDPAPKRLPDWVVPVLACAGVVIILISLATYFLLRLNRRLAGTESELRLANRSLSTQLSEIEVLHQRIQEQAVRDALTGLYNRRYLDEMLEREIARAKREGYPISLAIIDLDHFKQVNDTYGHQAGDLVLQSLGQLLLDNAREGDIACRYGGEEFVLVLPRLSLESAFNRAEEWRREFMGRMTRHGDLEIASTMSIGLATYPGHASNGNDLIQKADEALYQAKTSGRNRTQIAA